MTPRVNSIFKNINPDGFLIKNDVGPEEIVAAIKKVINDPPYYSKSVVKMMRKFILNDFVVDELDRQLLFELSMGTKMKDIAKILPLSLAAIERRKRNLKVVFNVKKEDRELIIKAKDKGFI